ncbi:hypothetical protein V6N11_078098 [Hibiscus sabdariffa]|uniref:Myb/SANT-like domain-containing protein n=1 Tax=Hibiscus sabdariffa TaxID=183260 RepID=A0ABR2TFQ4_9ROSI
MSNPKSSKEGGMSKQFRWTKPMERIFLEILAEEAQKGNKPSNSFRSVSIKRVAAAISEKFQVQCDTKHVENHLRTVKNAWKIICKIREESGFGWDDNMKMITSDNVTYDATITAHPKYSPFLNKKIDFYNEMALVVGQDMATGSFAKTFADVDLDDANESSIPLNFNTEDVHEERTNVSSSGEKLGKIAEALKKFTEDKTPLLYEEVMSMETEGFDDDFLCNVFDFLAKNEFEAKAFLAKKTKHRKIWLQKFIQG